MIFLFSLTLKHFSLTSSFPSSSQLQACLLSSFFMRFLLHLYREKGGPPSQTAALHCRSSPLRHAAAVAVLFPAIPGSRVLRLASALLFPSLLDHHRESERKPPTTLQHCACRCTSNHRTCLSTRLSTEPSQPSERGLFTTSPPLDFGIMKFYKDSSIEVVQWGLKTNKGF